MKKVLIFSNLAFYYCEDCGVEKYRPAYFCEQCYDPEYHEEHDSFRVDDEAGNRSEYPTCTCGIAWKNCPDSFCQHHGKDSQEIALNDEEVERFTNFFKPLYEILFYVKDSEGYTRLSNQIEEELIKTLKQLNEDCQQYIRMTIKLYETTVNTPKGEDKIFKQLIKRDMHLQLFDLMKIDGILRAKFSRYHLQVQQSGYNNSYYAQLLKKTKGSIQMVDNLGQEGEYLPESYQKYVCFAEKGEEGRKSLDEFLHHIQKSLTNEQFNEFLENQVAKTQSFDQFDEDTLFFLLKKLLQAFQGQSPQSFSYHQEQTFIELVGDLILTITQGNFEKINNIKEIMNTKSINSQLIDNFIPFLVQNHKYFYGNFSYIFLILLSNNYEQEEKLIQTFWKRFFSYSLRNSWENNIKNIYNLINRILNIEKLCLESEKQFLDQEMQNEESEESQGSEEKTGEELEKDLREKFINFLKAEKQIKAKIIWSKKRNGELNFSNAGQLLNQLCFFNEDCNQFFLKDLSETETKEEEKTVQIPLFPENGRSDIFQYLYHCQINYNKEIMIEKELSEKMLKMFFSPPFFFRQLKNKWVKTLENNPNESSQVMRCVKELKIGYIYVFFLVFTLKISENPNLELVEELQKLRSDQTYRFPFEHFGNASYIKRVLCLKEEEKNEQIGGINQSSTKGKTLKEKAAEKKKKIYDKYKQKGTTFLKNLSTKSLNMEIEENEDVCLLCHEKQKPNNQLVFMAQLKKNKILSSSYYGEDDKSSLLFKSCMHTLHLNCYTKMMQKKSLNYFNCPLCSKKMNCILPRSFNPETPRNFEICCSSIAICFGINYEIFNDESLFMLLLKHLVQSKGLHTLFSLNRYHLEKFVWRKFNKYAENLMIQLFEKASQNEKNIYIKGSKKFIQDVKTCEKEHLSDLQTIIIETILSKVKGENEININLLNKIKAYSNDEEFEVILEELEELLEKPIYLIEEVEKQKTRYFSLKISRPPEDTSQIKKIMKRKCNFCSSKKNTYQCLICESILCCNCFNDHKVQHKNMNFDLYFPKMRIQCNNLQTSSTCDVYFNDFWMSYQSASDKERQNEIFRLKEKKFIEMMNKFLEI